LTVGIVRAIRPPGGNPGILSRSCSRDTARDVCGLGAPATRSVTKGGGEGTEGARGQRKGLHRAPWVSKKKTPPPPCARQIATEGRMDLSFRNKAKVGLTLELGVEVEPFDMG